MYTQIIMDVVYALISRSQAVFSDDKVSIYSFRKNEFNLKKASEVKQFFKYILFNVCNSELSPEFARDAYDSSTHILCALDLANQQLFGIAFLKVIPYSDFIINNRAFCFNVFGVHLDPSPTIGNVLYISLLCSFTHSKCGEKIINYVEKHGFSYYSCDAIALHSTPSRYSYYVSKGFYRTNDLASIYPVFEKESTLIFNNSRGISQIRGNFDYQTDLASYVFFKGECHLLYQSFKYLFMKPCKKGQFGGYIFKKKLNEAIRIAQETVRQKNPYHKPVTKSS